MKKNVRFYITLYFVKMVIKIMKLLGRNATFFPGSLALKMCPKILSMLTKPKKVICITGTNGKTTTSNMIGDLLKSSGISYMHNGYGSNTLDGIISSFISFSDLKGDLNYDFGIVEVDERSSFKVYEQLTPDYLVVTNLFRDSYSRNAHADYIKDILEKSTPDSTHLVLNADDLISSQIKPKSRRTYFSMNLLSGEEEVRDSRIKDVENCPKCNHKLVPQFIRYNHIGRYTCSNCDFESPKGDYVLRDVDREKKKAYIIKNGKEYEFHQAGENIVDVYNLLTAVSALNTAGVEMNVLTKASENIEVLKSRFNDRIIGNTRLVYMMAKQVNPIASSRTFDYIRKQKGNMALVFTNSQMSPDKLNSENPAWLYDLDFKYLLLDNIKQYVTCGKRHQDFENALLLSGIPKEKITDISGWENVAESIKYDEVDTIFVVMTMDTFKETDVVYGKIEEILKKREGIK